MCFCGGRVRMNECKKMLIELIKKSNDTKAVCFLCEIAKRILG